MIKLKRLMVSAAIVTLVLVAAEIGSQLSVPGIQSSIPDAEARVGRPFMPVNAAGVA